jgi:transcriptional regulator with XRE-family HTH domain
VAYHLPTCYVPGAQWAALRAERERQGLSLADINERTGIDRAALSRLENNEDANPTLATLERYAEAVGKKMVVLISEPATLETERPRTL